MQQSPQAPPPPGPSPVPAAGSVDPSETGVPRSSRLPLRQRLAFAWKGAGELWGVYWWLIRDLVREFPLRAAAAIALSFATPVFQWASVLIVLAYVNARVSSEGGGDGFSLPIVGALDLSIGDSVGTLFAWGAVALALVFLAALTGYGANAVGLHTARRYVRRAGGKILSAVQANPSVLAAAARGQDETDPARILRGVLVRETQRLLRSLFVVIRTADSGARLVVAGSLIILINPLLTLVLAGVGLIFAIPLYGVNRQVARASLEYESTGRDASLYSAWLAKLVLHSDRSPVSIGHLPRLYAESETIDRKFGSVSELILARYRSQYIVTAFAGVAAVMIVFAFTLSGTADIGGWTTALLYLVALLAATASLSAISVAVTVASRFLPQVRRYTSLMQVSAAMAPVDGESVAGSATPSPRVIRVGPEGLGGSLSSVQLNPGEPIFVHAPDHLDRTSVENFLVRLFGLSRSDAAELRRHVFLCGDIGSPPLAGAVELTGAGNNAEDAPKVAGHDELVDLEGREEDEEASAEWSYAVHARQGLQGGVSMVIFGWRSFSRLDSAVRARLLASFDGLLVLLVSDRMPGRQPEEAVATVLVDEHGVRGIADSDLHREWVRRPAESGQQHGVEGDSLEDELDEI